MSVVPIRGGEQDEELFQTLAVWTVPEVYFRPTDWWTDLHVEAGWNPANGETVRIEHREFTLAEATQLVTAMQAAIAYLRGGGRG